MRTIAISVAIAVMAVVAGCGGGDKAGGSGGQVTLTMGTDDPAGRPASRAIKEFAERTGELSGGTVRIEPVFQAAGHDVDDWDQRVARKVVAGELDMGMIPTRAWDTEGVTSLRALQAPFLITSDELMARVATGEIATELLSGLKDKGVVGLALVPEGLRHPFAFGDALLAPSDYDGKAMRSARSDVSYALLRALGASPDDQSGTFDARTVGRSVAAIESSFALATTLPSSTATGNVTFFPKLNSLAINAGVWDDLTDEQQQALREAARRTVDWARGANLPDAEAAHRFCDAGGSVVLAEQEQVDALVEAARPVYAHLERDATTNELITRIRALKQQVKASAGAEVRPCAPSRDSAGAPQPQSGTGGIPNGVYRNLSEKHDLVEAGLDEQQAEEYSGLHTMTLEDGRLEDVQKSDTVFAPCLGSYSSTDSTIEIRHEENCSGGFTAQWTLEDGELRLTEIHSDDPAEDRLIEAVFGASPFRKID